MNYRPSYAEINLAALKHNISMLTDRYSDYEHHFAVVKADSYGHGAIPCAKVAIESGCDYLCVATLDEALELRSQFENAPILCLGIIKQDHLPICASKHITITLPSLNYIKQMPKDLEILAHLKINTGMNRLGLSTREEINEALRELSQSNIRPEGIYTHIFQADNPKNTEAQYARFENITQDCDLLQFNYVHVGASDATEFYHRRHYANACRIGISMYGLVDYPELQFQDTFKLISEVAQINEVSEGSVGYDGIHKIEGHERIAIIPLGYADGIIRKNTGRSVFINNQAFPIVGNICMDMLLCSLMIPLSLAIKLSSSKELVTSKMSQAILRLFLTK